MPSERSSEEFTESQAYPHPQYISLLSSHVQDTRAHYSGQDHEQALPPSFFFPSSFWTSADKDAFFHGLAIYSRLRPDLIAAEIKTKTIADVCIYLDMLEEGSARNPPRPKRKDVPAAWEVSDRWLAFEEEQVTAFISAEPGMEAQALEHAREEEKRDFKTSIRARKGGARTALNERDREGEKKRKVVYDQWLEQREAEWRAQDALGSMDAVALKAMHHILRDDTATKDEDQDMDVKQEDAQETAELSAAHAMESTTARAIPLPDGLIPFDDDLIDPALRAISHPSVASSVTPSAALEAPPQERPATPPPPTGEQACTNHRSNDRFGDTFNPITPPFQRHASPVPSPVQTFPARSKPLRTAEDDLVDADLSPASRRRLMKRLYMRRKRAERSGIVADESLDMLKRGRKRKKRHEKRGRNDKEDSVLGDAADGDGLDVQEQHEQAVAAEDAADQTRTSAEAKGEDEGEYRHRNRSGRTRREKMLQTFTEMGFTSERLNDEGLGLLHLGGVARLMRFYNRLNDAPPGVSSEISIDLIKLLNALVVRFTTELVHRAIVSREQERLAKTRTKAWRLESKLITPINVAHALALTREVHVAKREYFEEMARELGLAEEEQSDEDEKTGSDRPLAFDKGNGKGKQQAVEEDHDRSSGPEGEDEDIERDILPASVDVHPTALPLHRAIFAPFLRVPPSTLSSAKVAPPLDLSLFMSWPSASLSANDSPEDDVIPQDVDEDLLLSELLEEEELDKRDAEASAAYEEKLWAQFKQPRHLAAPQAQPADSQPSAAPPTQPPVPSLPSAPQEVPAPALQAQLPATFKAQRPTRRSRKRKRAELDGDHSAEVGDRLRFMEPGGRVKSSVYVEDSDG